MTEREPMPERRCFTNRELSWLAFNRRVLEEAEDANNPLGEQLSFAAIFQSNLDEFFMVRVGGLTRRLGSMVRDNKTHLTPRQQLDLVAEQTREDLSRKDEVYAGLMERLAREGRRILAFEETTGEQRRYLERRFRREVEPLLSPQIVSPRQSFPFLSAREIYAVAVLEKRQGARRVGIVPCTPAELERLVRVGEGEWVLMEELILHFLPRIFQRYTIVSSALVRLLRSADLDMDEAMGSVREGYRSAMEELLGKRQRLRCVGMNYQEGEQSEETVETLCRALRLPRDQAYPSRSPLDLRFLAQIQDSLRRRRELFYPRRLPQSSLGVDPLRPMLEQLRERDFLLSYPYESMEPFLRLLREAGGEPSVRAIAMTLYRVARNSQVVDALCQAAMRGKDVLVVVELRARFDEENNIAWSRVLEQAGCRVIYGLRGIKIHSKLCLITAREGEKPFYYTQIGTGNYNEQTARQYTDLSLMTADQAIGAEAQEVFRLLAQGRLMEQCNHLLMAPRCLRRGLCELIDAQIQLARSGQGGYIGIKCNSVTDKLLMEKLIEASQAGVKIEMVVRGICCLIPGVPGYTENIRIVSIVGRYLEHERIYLFGRGEGQRTYISSADFMSRNTTRRLEAAAPVGDPELEERLREMFRVMMADNVKGREQRSDGSYVRRSPGAGEEPLNAQEHFLEQAQPRKVRRHGSPRCGEQQG